MPHALLFTGIQGLGKAQFARCFSQALLCAAPQDEGRACQTCGACLLFRAGNHPDYLKIEPEDQHKTIGIEKIREVIGRVTLKSHNAGYRTITILPADRMSLAAANSLLKILEEPPENLVLMLITSKPSTLSATVQSRCQRVQFRPPPFCRVRPWLSRWLAETDDPEKLLILAQGAPLGVLDLREQGAIELRSQLMEGLHSLSQGRINAIELASAWQSLELRQILFWLSSWTIDLLRLKSMEHPPYLTNTDFRKTLNDFAQGCELLSLHRYWIKLQEDLRFLQGRASNSQLLLENLLISWPVRLKHI